MIHPILHIAQVVAATGLVMATVQGLLLRLSIVGLTGILLELGGRIALTAFNAALLSAVLYQHPRA